MNSSKKIIRQENLSKMLERNPFLTDEQLAKALEVSIQTIRLDRLRMNIPEVRERTRQMAETAQTKLKAIDKKDIVGDYKHPTWMAVFGTIVVALTAYMSVITVMNQLPKLLS